MIQPQHDPRDRPLIEQPTWRSILVSYALVAAVPLLLWAISNLLAGTVTLVGVTALVIGGRHAYKLRRCFYRCQKLTFQLGEIAQITITQLPTDDAN